MSVALAAAFALALPLNDAVLTSTVSTERFKIHARPGSRAEAALDRTAAMAERDLDTILAALEFRWTGETIRLFLYDDVAELQKITGVPSGGHSVPLESHVPHDNDQTRLHELVHVVAERLPERGPESRNLFFAEGLANAVLEFVHGVPVHAVAAWYRRNDRLPALEEMTGAPDFYAWLGRNPGFNGYDVAGSYHRYLLDEFGAKRVRRYYRGVPAKKALGKTVAQLEKAWHATLDEVEMNTGLVALLAERNGGPSALTTFEPAKATLDAAVLGPDSEWTSLMKSSFDSNGPGHWERKGGKLHGEGPGDDGTWSLAFLGDDALGDCMIRATATPTGGCWGVQIQLGTPCQAMILGNGAFLYTEIGGIGHDGKVRLSSGTGCSSDGSIVRTSRSSRLFESVAPMSPTTMMVVESGR